MSLIDRILRRGPLPPEAKVSRAAPLLALYGQGRPLWSERETRTLAENGFRRNAVVHRAVKLVTDAASSLPLTLQEGGVEADAHPLLDLLARPNPRQAGGAFLEAVYGHLLVAGNAYLELVRLEGRPRELYALRPDRMRVVPGPEGWPEAYDYTVGGRSVRFAQQGEPPPILHLTMFDPIDDWYGFPPLAAAQTALDLHNAASAWHKALLDNSARPSGALVYAGEGANLSDEQFRRLKEELETNFQGAANAGRPILLEGGLDWKPLSMSPKDVEFGDARNAAAREIALAFGVPPLLLGLPGDNTHANYAEANRAFWRQTVIPLATRVSESLTQWLAPVWGGALRLEPDLDRVEALAAERESLWQRVGGAAFLTDDEKRAAVGYGAKSASPHAEEARRAVSKHDAAERRFNDNHDPDNGRFTTGPGGTAPVDGRIGVAPDGTPVVGVGATDDEREAYKVDLEKEEGTLFSPGGHAIREHVNVSINDMIRRAQSKAVAMGSKPENQNRAAVISKFDSLAVANQAVSRTIQENAESVDLVRSGALRRVVIESTFTEPVGDEVLVPVTDPSRFLIRRASQVRVVVDRNTNRSNGFNVTTAYVKNPDSRYEDEKRID